MKITGVMPRKMMEVARMTGTDSQRMSKMGTKIRSLNKHLSQYPFYIERKETWTSAMTMRKSCILKSELCVSSLRKTRERSSTQRTNSYSPLKLKKDGSSSISKRGRPPLRYHLGMP